MATTTQTMINFELNSVKQAVDVVVAILRRAGYKNIARHGLNDGAHWILEGINQRTETGEIFYIKWEKELFHKAGILIPELRGTRGACTMNVEFAEKAFALNCHILFANKEDSMIYDVETTFFMRNSFERPQDISGEVTRCIAVENLKPWQLGLQYGQRLFQQSNQQEGKKEKEEGMVLLLKCLDCGYARIQTKQDDNGIELTKIIGTCHSNIFTHRMIVEKISRSAPLALKLMEALQWYQRW
jgi:hypothetical protein